MQRNISAWDTPEPLSSNTILPEVNPWDSSTSPTDESSGWANFDNFDSSLHIASMNVLQSAFVPSAVVAEADNKQQVPETTTSTTDKDTTSTSAVPTSPSSSPSPSSSDIKPVEPSAADDKITAANINEEQNTIISNTIKEISNPESNVSSINVNDNANVEPIENITPSNR